MEHVATHLDQATEGDAAEQEIRDREGAGAGFAAPSLIAEYRETAAVTLSSLLNVVSRAEGAVRFGADPAELASVMEEIAWHVDHARTALDAMASELSGTQVAMEEAEPASQGTAGPLPQQQATGSQDDAASNGSGLLNAVRETVAAADEAASRASRAAGRQVMSEAYEQHRITSLASLETAIAHAQLALAAAKWEPENYAVIAQYLGQSNRCIQAASHAVEARLQLADIEGRVMAARGETAAPARDPA